MIVDIFVFFWTCPLDISDQVYINSYKQGFADQTCVVCPEKKFKHVAWGKAKCCIPMPEFYCFKLHECESVLKGYVNLNHIGIQ